MTPEKIVINGKSYKLVPESNDEGATAPKMNNESSMVGGKKSKKQMSGKKTRKLSPYMKFAQEARKKIIAEEPELKSDIIKVGKRIGEMWRGLSPEEKAKY
jgi:hypothetical protein